MRVRQRNRDMQGELNVTVCSSDNNKETKMMKDFTLD